jgi:uncharacterized protein (TIGR02246 family)
MATLTRLLAMILFCTGPVVLASDQAGTGEAEGLVARFVTAWNAHEPAAFAVLMAADADWVTASGIRLRGRDRIQAYLAEEHATWARPTSMRAMNIHVRRLDRVTAIVLFEWEIVTPGKDGGTPSVARGNNLFVASHDKGWTIVAGQVARARTQ